MLRDGSGGQLNTLRTQVPAAAVKMGLVIDPAAPPTSGPGVRTVHMSYGGSESSLSNYDYGRVINIVWDLIIEGVLRPGLGDGNNNDLPWFHITERGKAVLKDGPQSPYDP